MSTPAAPAAYIAVVRQWAEETTNRLAGADPTDAANLMRRAVVSLGERLAWAEHAPSVAPGWRPRWERDGRDAQEVRLLRLLRIYAEQERCSAVKDDALGVLLREIERTAEAWVRAVGDGTVQA